MSVAQAVARLGHAPARLCNLHSVTPGLSSIAFVLFMCVQYAVANELTCVIAGRIGLPTWRLLPGLRALRSASTC